MRLSIIVAVSENGIIGKDNQLIWHLPADLKFFKQTTKGRAVIMGRKNFESIPEKFRPLPGRTNIIVSRDRAYKADGCILVHSIEDAIAYAKSINEEEAFVIGGGEIYKQSMDLIDCLYITRVHSNFDGDTYFEPDLSLWEKVSERHYPADDKNRHSHTYELYKRA